MKVLIKLPKTVTEDTSLAKTKYAVMKVSDFSYSLMLNDHTPIEHYWQFAPSRNQNKDNSVLVDTLASR